MKYLRGSNDIEDYKGYEIIKEYEGYTIYQDGVSVCTDPMSYDEAILYIDDLLNTESTENVSEASLEMQYKAHEYKMNHCRDKLYRYSGYISVRSQYYTVQEIFHKDYIDISGKSKKQAASRLIYKISQKLNIRYYDIILVDRLDVVQ